MTDAENADSGTVTRQPPESKVSEFASAAVGDEMYVEFELASETGIYGVRGEVFNVTSWDDRDGCTERRVVEIDPTKHDIIEWVKLAGLVAPDGEGVINDKINLKRRTRRNGEKYEGTDVQVMEVEKR